MSPPAPTETTESGSGSGVAAPAGAAKAAVVVPVAESPAATTTMAGPVAEAQEGEGKGREGRADVKKSWVEELRKAVEAEGKEGNSAIADSDEESDIEAPAAPIHRRQGHQARSDQRRHQAPEEDEEEKARYASMESAIAFLREHGVDAKDFAK
ncbi:hypothetical protein C8A01DRAFT_36592 [Parachaetomium inaequale]|uniref:Uncharacterized protein n=1 Tax=Parachaetomium inaequale TaxID=2588326 RepID=A0AAN6PI79_9PEZI|nr:hypothetical protein C8A01DRAFT_36592 [Parachaetomium inaequale]